MKKLIYLIVLALILGLVLTGCLLSNVGQVPSTKQGSEIIPEIGDLVAGQNEIVGNVEVWYADGNLCIRYNITDPCWLLLETHWEVSIGNSLFPVNKKGNPKIGKFSYGDDTLGTFVEGDPEAEPPIKNSYAGGVKFYEECIPVEEISEIIYGDDICIAAHASMVNICEEEIREETAWAFGTPFDGNSWATYFCLKKTIEEWPEGGTTTVAFEDLPFRKSFDWDYNDWVADINTVATFWGTEVHKDLESIDFTIIPEARGAGYKHVFHIAIPAYTFGSNGTYTLTLYDENHNEMSGYPETGNFYTSEDNDFIVIPSTWEALPPVPPLPFPEHPGVHIHTNTYESEAYIPPQRTATLSIVFDELVPFDLNVYTPENVHGEGLFFDPYLYVVNTKNKISRTDPRMLTVPVDWMWPEEKRNIWKAYTNVGEVASLAVPPTNPDDPTHLPVFCLNWWVVCDLDFVYEGKP